MDASGVHNAPAVGEFVDEVQAPAPPWGSGSRMAMPMPAPPSITSTRIAVCGRGL
jgi:hypothetical protein